MIASANASTRMIGSAMQNIFTFKQERPRDLGESRPLKIEGSRKAALNASHPGAETTAKASPAKTTTVLTVAIRTARRPLKIQRPLLQGRER